MQVQGIALEALARAEANVSRAAERVSHAALPTSDSVSLSAAAIDLMQARTAFEVAVVIAKTADDITRESLEVFG